LVADQHEQLRTAALTFAVAGAMSAPPATIDQKGVRVVLPAGSPRLTPAAAFDQFLAGRGIFAIAELLTAEGIPSPSAHDPGRNRHRCGLAWS
jgi:hypothetical protein